MENLKPDVLQFYERKPVNIIIETSGLLQFSKVKSSNGFSATLKRPKEGWGSAGYRVDKILKCPQLEIKKVLPHHIQAWIHGRNIDAQRL